MDVGTLSGDDRSAYPALNNKGEIAGSSLGLGTRAFRWTLSGGIEALPGFGGAFNTQPYAINDNGQIVGYSQDANGTGGPVLWTPDGNLQSLGTLPGDTGGYAAVINAAGHVGGFSRHQIDRGMVGKPFFWTPEAGMIDIGGGEYYVGLERMFGLNDRDQLLAQAPSGPNTYLWSPTLNVHTVGPRRLQVQFGAFNDAGQFLVWSHLYSPVMRIGLSSSQNPAHAGQTVTFTAVVSAIVGSAPDGEVVSFYDGSKELGTGALNNGIATFPTSKLTVGTHNIGAKYVGDGNYAPSRSAKLQQVVNR